MEKEDEANLIFVGKVIEVKKGQSVVRPLGRSLKYEIDSSGNTYVIKPVKSLKGEAIKKQGLSYSPKNMNYHFFYKNGVNYSCFEKDFVDPLYNVGDTVILFYFSYESFNNDGTYIYLGAEPISKLSKVKELIKTLSRRRRSKKSESEEKEESKVEYDSSLTPEQRKLMEELVPLDN